MRRKINEVGGKEEYRLQREEEKNIRRE